MRQLPDSDSMPVEHGSAGQIQEKIELLQTSRTVCACSGPYRPAPLVALEKTLWRMEALMREEGLRAGEIAPAMPAGS